MVENIEDRLKTNDGKGEKRWRQREKREVRERERGGENGMIGGILKIHDLAYECTKIFRVY
eukprot:1173319-Amorphochlora_amoeboformis.AAC.1